MGFGLYNCQSCASIMFYRELIFMSYIGKNIVSRQMQIESVAD